MMNRGMDRRTLLEILAAAGQGPRHRYGQNFMVDQRVLEAIVEAGTISGGDLILEIGPGVGNLTERLAASAARVLAVEIDAKLMAAAQAHHAGLSNVTWLCGDALAGKHALNPDVITALRDLRRGYPYASMKLVSNLPYNAASPLVAELLVLAWHEQRAGRSDAVILDQLTFTVQWEVAQRMAAGPGTGAYGPLGILLQLLGTVAIERKIPPGAFWPAPQISSGLVVVTPDHAKLAQVRDVLSLQKLLAGLFGHRRQTVHNALKHYLQKRWTPELARQISEAGIDLTRRPENLQPQQFLTLDDLTRQVDESGR